MFAPEGVNFSTALKQIVVQCLSWDLYSSSSPIQVLFSSSWTWVHCHSHSANDAPTTRITRRLYWFTKGQFIAISIISAIFLFACVRPNISQHWHALHCLQMKLWSSLKLTWPSFTNLWQFRWHRVVAPCGLDLLTFKTCHINYCMTTFNPSTNFKWNAIICELRRSQPVRLYATSCSRCTHATSRDVQAASHRQVHIWNPDPHLPFHC